MSFAPIALSQESEGLGINFGEDWKKMKPKMEGSAKVYSEAWRTKWPEMEELRITKISDNIHMIDGAGGTIGIFTGPDGALLIDSGHYRVLESRLFPSVEKIAGNKLVRYVINTHGHGDHGAGNTHYAKLGAIAISHKMTRDEYANPPSHYPPVPEKGLPVITFNDRANLQFNDQTIELIHAPFGHSRSDVIVYFAEENVVHTGDIFVPHGYTSVAGMYREPKGSSWGLIEAQEMVLALGDDETKFITGHAAGIVGTRDELERTHQVLVETVEKIQNGIDAGMSLEEIIATKPAKIDYTWPGMTAERTVDVLYYGIVGDPPESRRRSRK